ncbi:MAG: hypothetical protein EZS28_039654 [Streblomastix strix]|uniref:Uncharacterized protein n=1 Tax=Streblomastix strix TaxID=222440 RepID=A0A5J4U3F3_9EUKA|nr:MAG: hypothetical protein EZS28_039654 [Streblomastix strix]
MDTWHVNGKGTFETSSHVYETVKKQTGLIATGLFGDAKVNYLNSNIKLQDELAIYKANRAAFLIKEGPFITFSFGAKLGQIIQQANSENRQTVHRLFLTITYKLLLPNTKYMPVRTEQQQYAAMCLFKDIYDKSLAVEVAVSGMLNKYDCEFQGTYILDNYKNPTLNEEPNASPSDPKEPDSHIDEVIIKHDGKLASPSLPIFTITNVFNQMKLIAPFDQGGRTASSTFNSNVSEAGFAKTGKDDTLVLLAGGGDALISSFGGLELVNINYTSNVVSPTSIMSLKCYRYGSLINFYGYIYIYMGNGAGASGASVAVCTLESAGFPKYLFYADDIVFAGSAPHVANFRFGTD